jgi:hypothetical protein
MSDRAERASARTAVPWRLRVALALLVPGLGSLAALVVFWGGRWAPFYFVVFGVFWATPVLMVAAALAYPILRFAVTPELAWPGSWKTAASLAMFAGLFGHLALGAYLLWGFDPMPIATLDRPNLSDRMPPIAKVARAPESAILDLSLQLGYPYTLGGGWTLDLVSPKNGVFTEWSVLPDRGIPSMEWSRSEGRLFIVEQRGLELALFRVARDGSREEVRLPADAALPRTGTAPVVTVTADGRYLVEYSIVTEGEVHPDGTRNERSRISGRRFPIDHEGPAEPLTFAVHDRSVANLTWSPDGSWLVYSDTCGACPWLDDRMRADERCNVCILRAGSTGDAPRVLLRGESPWPAGRIWSLDISPDGAMVAVTLGGPRVLWLVPVNGTPPHTLSLPPSKDGPSSVTSVAWSPSSDRLALLSDAFGQLHSGQDLGSFREQSIYVVGVDGSGLHRLSARTQAQGQLRWFP